MIEDEVRIATAEDCSGIEDDTEESVSGSDYHLAAIVALYEVLLRYARAAGRRWYVTAEVLVLADLPERPGNPWRAMPDVYVVRDLAGTPRTSLDTRAGQGTPFPQFVCEVASESTRRRDVEEKQRVYADLGVREYLVIDPTPGAGLLGVAVQAWRRDAQGQWGRWAADVDGFLESRVLDGLRLRLEEHLLRVYTPEGERLPTGAELAADLARERARRVEQERLTREQERLTREQERLATERATLLVAQEKIAREQAAELARERAQRAALEAALAQLRAGNDQAGQ